MLHILLLILKMIGVILLCILGILILGIVCALFVPIRYRIEAVRREGEGEPPVVVQVKVTWLLHLINLLIRFDGSLFLRARLAIVTVFKLPKREKQRGKEPEREKRHKKRGKKNKDAGPESGGTPEEESGAGGKTEEKPQTGEPETAGQHDGEASGDKEENQNKAENPSFFDRLRAIPVIIRSIFEKIKGFFENIQYTIQKFCDRIRSVSGNIVYYREILEGEPFQRSFALCRDELLAIGRSLKPDRFEVQMIVGLDDPAATGEVLAVCGMLYPFLGRHMDVAGDFEKKRLEGRVFIKGKMRFFTFLRTAVKVYFNKDIRKLVKLLKKEAA